MQKQININITTTKNKTKNKKVKRKAKCCNLAQFLVLKMPHKLLCFEAFFSLNKTLDFVPPSI